MIDDINTPRHDDDETDNGAGAVFEPDFKTYDATVAALQQRADQATAGLNEYKGGIRFLATRGLERTIQVHGIRRAALLVDFLASAHFTNAMLGDSRERIEFMKWQAEGLDVKPSDEGGDHK